MADHLSSRLTSLPPEIRHQILEYLFPVDSIGLKNITFHIDTKHTENWDTQPHAPITLLSILTNPPLHLLRSFLYGIGLVNRALHADAMIVLYSRTFTLSLDDDHLHPLCSRLLLGHDSSVRLSWQWDPFLLRGLDLTRGRAFRIEIIPGTCPDAPRMQHVEQALVSLFSAGDEVVHWDPVRNMELEIVDFKEIIDDISTRIVETHLRVMKGVQVKVPEPMMQDRMITWVIVVMGILLTRREKVTWK
ncbi:MAG: hypothetical protein Q9191_007968 [Dirinaria sp. TL-2023a]